MNLPNIIALARLFAAPFVVWLILTGAFEAAFWVFAAASISDGVDGFIAKQFNQVTVIGAYLDPLADKALLVGVYVVLGKEGALDLWIVMLVVFRDLVIIGGAILFWMLARSLTMEPLLVSKFNTVAQFLLASFMLADIAYDIVPQGIVPVLIALVAATTLFSGGLYVIVWTRRTAGLLEEGDEEE